MSRPFFGGGDKKNNGLVSRRLWHRRYKPKRLENLHSLSGCWYLLSAGSYIQTSL